MKSRYQGTRRKNHPPTQNVPFFVSVAIALLGMIVVACAGSGNSGSTGAVTGVPTFPPDFLNKPYQPSPNPKGPKMPVMGLEAVKPGPNGMVTKDAVQTYASTHPIPLAIATESPKITKVEILAIATLAQILVTDPSGDCMGHPAVYVEFQGKFAFPGNPASPTTYPTAFEIYCLDSGNIVQEGGLGNPTPPLPDITTTPTTAPTPTPIVPTATPVAKPVFNFTVSPTGTKQACSSSTTLLPVFTMNLDNTHSNTDVTWKVTVTENEGQQPWAVPFATSGTVTAGQSSPLSVSPQIDLCSKIPGNVVTNLHIVITMTNGPGTAFTFTDAITGPPVIG